MTTTLERVHAARRVVQSDVKDVVRGVTSPPKLNLDERQRTALEAIRRDGFAIVEGYWPRERAFELRDRLETYIEDATGNTEYEGGAYLRAWDANAYDQGVRRIYHVDRLLPELAEVRQDPFVLDVVHAYYRAQFHSGALVYQYNTQTNVDTRYYHVDAFSREFKTFLYLDDVDEAKGPFTYLSGTHRSHLTRLRKQIKGNAEGAPTSFSEDDLRGKLDRQTMLTGSAGTLIFADVRGFHRGSPQLGDSRSVLVNYLVKEPGDLALDR